MKKAKQNNIMKATKMLIDYVNRYLAYADSDEYNKSFCYKNNLGSWVFRRYYSGCETVAERFYWFLQDLDDYFDEIYSENYARKCSLIKSFLEEKLEEAYKATDEAIETLKQMAKDRQVELDEAFEKYSPEEKDEFGKCELFEKDGSLNWDSISEEFVYTYEKDDYEISMFFAEDLDCLVRNYKYGDKIYAGYSDLEEIK